MFCVIWLASPNGFATIPGNFILSGCLPAHYSQHPAFCICLVCNSLQFLNDPLIDALSNSNLEEPQEVEVPSASLPSSLPQCHLVPTGPSVWMGPGTLRSRTTSKGQCPASQELEDSLDSPPPILCPHQFVSHYPICTAVHIPCGTSSCLDLSLSFSQLLDLVTCLSMVHQVLILSTLVSGKYRVVC